MAINKDSVLQVFLDYPDREMRAIDVWQYLKDSGKTYYRSNHIGGACVQLHRDGKLFRKREGQFVWYCIAREMR